MEVGVGGNQYPSIDRRATRSLAMQIEVKCACTAQLQATLLYLQNPETCIHKLLVQVIHEQSFRAPATIISTLIKYS